MVQNSALHQVSMMLACMPSSLLVYRGDIEQSVAHKVDYNIFV